MSNEALLGTEVEQPEVETAEEETGTEETSAEQTEGETEEAENTEEVEEEQASDEELADPEFQKYMKRYGVTKEMLEANPSLPFLIRDKIATDKNFSELNSKLKDKPETKAEETKDQPAVNVEEHLKQTFAEAAKYTDPKVREALVAQLSAAKNVGEQLDVLQGAMHNYLKTALAELLPGAIENKFAGFGNQWNAWSSNAAHEAAYAELRKDNTNLPENYQEVVDKALKILPMLSQPMTPKERLEASVKLVYGGEKAVEQVAKALETGKRLSKTSDQKKELGKSLGAGQTKGSIGKTSEKTDELSQAIERHNANLSPFGKK